MAMSDILSILTIVSCEQHCQDFDKGLYRLSNIDNCYKQCYKPNIVQYNKEIDLSAASMRVEVMINIYTSCV